MLVRNPRFTGRGDELAALASALAAGSTVTVQAVRGMGGVGKTQLAVEFAYQHACDYDLVYWLATEETATMPDRFSALAADLGLEPVPDPDGLLSLIDVVALVTWRDLAAYGDVIYCLQGPRLAQQAMRGILLSLGESQ